MDTRKPGPFFQEERILEAAGRQVMTDVNRFFSKERLEQAAMQDERLRLARELHDGVLQSLAGAALQLEAMSRLIEENPEAARDRLRDIEKLIAEEQRELRRWIEKLHPTATRSIATGADLAAALEQVRQRAEWQWGLRVDLAVDSRGSVPRVLGDQIYRIVQEAVTNAGRHARANRVRIIVHLGTGSSPARITITDDGCGFPFRGRYDLATLNQKRIGPRSLRERVAALRGGLVLNSELSGSQLEISLPTDQPSARRSPGKPSG
ncbi:MAG TPA: sensor histidine kinase [Casimicrobiaceae bacterium]|nr:sensor histidine kinase [Casimicrobiaceae bacterium]